MQLPFAMIPWYGATFGLALAGLLYCAYRLKDGVGRAPGPSDFPLTPGVDVSDEDLRDLSLGAFLSSMWRFPVNTLETNAHPAQLKNVLAESWGVTTPDEARTTLRWLVDEGHRGAFDAVLRVAGADPEGVSPGDFDEALGGGASVRFDEPLRHYRATRAELERRGMLQGPADAQRGTAAWDYSRAVTVARFMHSAGLIGADDAWSVIREVGARSRALFASWDEFLRSYVIGRAMWNGPSQLEDPLVSAMIERVANDPASPWKRVAW